MTTMHDVLTRISMMNRPRVLIRAARIGAEAYRRDTHLQRLLGRVPRTAPALEQLMDLEEGLNRQRGEDEASYSPMRHVDVMIALVAEARLLRAGCAAQATAPVRLAQ